VAKFFTFFLIFVRLVFEQPKVFYQIHDTVFEKFIIIHENLRFYELHKLTDCGSMATLKSPEQMKRF
jgi:hypothetical protein